MGRNIFLGRKGEEVSVSILDAITHLAIGLILAIDRAQVGDGRRRRSSGNGMRLIATNEQFVSGP